MINDFVSAYPCCCSGFNTIPVDTTSTTKTSTIITSSCGYPCPYQFINTNQQQSFCSDTTFASNYACCCVDISTLISTTSSSSTSTTTNFAPTSSTTCNKINLKIFLI